MFVLYNLIEVFYTLQNMAYKNCLAVILIGNQTGKLSLGKELDKDMLFPIIFNLCIQDPLDKVREDMEMG